MLNSISELVLVIVTIADLHGQSEPVYAHTADGAYPLYAVIKPFMDGVPLIQKAAKSLLKGE